VFDILMLLSTAGQCGRSEDTSERTVPVSLRVPALLTIPVSGHLTKCTY